MSSKSNEETKKRRAATELLSRLSPLADDPILGLETWYTEFTSVDDDSLRSPAFDNTSEGYRIWLRA